MYNVVPFSTLLGKTIDMILFEQTNGEVTSINFDCSDGSLYIQGHTQECCECVMFHEIVGDIEDLIGLPILQAEESTNRNDPPLDGLGGASYTWTFYKLATNKGRVTLRWYGASNGNYSEEVSLWETKKP